MCPNNETIKNDMAGKKIDYKAEGLLFLKLKESGEKITHVSFCKQRGRELGKPLSLAYFRKVLRRLKGTKKIHSKIKKRKSLANTGKKKGSDPLSNEDGGLDSSCDWSTIKAGFMKGEYKNLSALAMFYGINPNSYKFRKRTKGWLKERLAISTKTSIKTVQNLIETRAADKARDMYTEILAAQWRIMDALKTAAESVSRWKTIDTPYAAGAVATYALNMQAVFEKIMPNLQGLIKLEEMWNIFDGLADNTMDIEQAAVGFVKLGVQMPEPLKMMLQKHQPEELPPDEGDEISEEQILAKRQEMLEQIEIERDEFVPQRKKDVAKLKDELGGADSFKDQAIQK
jgi:hypothetical protein